MYYYQISFQTWMKVERLLMPRSDNLYEVPDNILVPVDDGACDHLPGARLPSVALQSTSSRVLDLAGLTGRVVIYCYPRTGQPNVDPPPGWNEIPGARGCTPQSCAFRDHYQELQKLGAQIFGLSAQDTDYQREAAARLHLPFELLSDSSFQFTDRLRLPTFEAAGMRLIKRLTLITRDAQIEQVFYPVFPPDKNAEEVIAWLAKSSR